MSATIALVLNVTSSTIGDLKAKVTETSQSKQNLLNALENLISGVKSGTIDSTGYIVVRDTDPSVATSGAGSVSVSL